MTKEPRIQRSGMSASDPMGKSIALIFDSEDHMRAWVNDRIEEGRAKGQATALVDLQKQAQQLFKLVFGKDMA